MQVIRGSDAEPKARARRGGRTNHDHYKAATHTHIQEGATRSNVAWFFWESVPPPMRIIWDSELKKRMIPG